MKKELKKKRKKKQLKNINKRKMLNNKGGLRKD
jgi:hypothetical protein